MKLPSWLQRKEARQVLFVIGILIIWELIAISGVYSDILFPSWRSIGRSFVEMVQSGLLLQQTGFSLYLIGLGMTAGVVLAFVMATLAMASRFFADLAETIVAILNPLPGIALLPIVLLWFGTGYRSIIVIIIHSVVWPLMLNTYTGIRSVSQTQLEVGRNLGLRGLGLVRFVMVPAASPYILTGFKLAWAYAWRGVVAAEMVFGAGGGEGGLGWLIYQRRYFLDTSGVFAALLMIVLIGVLVEDVFFTQLEKRTIQRWGMTVAGG